MDRNSAPGVAYRILWRLNRIGIKTLRQAQSLSDPELLELRGVGRKSIAWLRSQSEGLDDEFCANDMKAMAPPSENRLIALAMRIDGVSPSTISKELGISRQRVYQIIGKMPKR